MQPLRHPDLLHIVRVLRERGPHRRPVCVRCGEVLRAADETVVDARTGFVTVLHLLCKSYTAPSLAHEHRGVPSVRQPRARLEWDGAVRSLRNRSVYARAVGNEGLRQIRGLLKMLEHPSRTP